MKRKLKATVAKSSPLILLVAPSPATPANLFSMEHLLTRQVNTEVNLQTCYYDLLQAANYDDTITQSDFITFIQLSSDNQFGVTNQWGINITGFNMLNPEFVSIYNLHACGDPLVGCPSIAGIDIGVGGSELQVSDGGGGGLLSAICNDVYGVIDELSVGAPTVSPALTAAPVESGAGAPTAGPTIAYVPTAAPFARVPITPVTTSSPSTSATAPTETTSCPDIYVPNTFYQPFDQVINPNDEFGGTQIYECKDAPYTPWCSQAAYEPGVAMPWGEAWSLVGECTTATVTTVPATEGPTITQVINPDLTTAAPVTTDVTTPSGVDGSTVQPTVEPGSTLPTVGSTDAVTTTDSTETGATPSPVPVSNPDGKLYLRMPVFIMIPLNIYNFYSIDPLYSGKLSIKFQYEVGNVMNLNANKITTGEPENDMLGVLLDSTTLLIEEVVADAFKSRGLRSTVVGVRLLQVSYSTGTSSIDTLEDICEYVLLH